MSSNIIYTKIDDVLLSCTSLKAQLAMIETILMSMLVAINTATTTGQFEEYKLDTGQTKSEIRYRDLVQLQKAYAAMFQSWQMVNNALGYRRTGRMFRNVPGVNFPGRGGAYGGYGY